MLRSPVEIESQRVRDPGHEPTSAATLANRARWFALIASILWLYTAWAPWVVRCPYAPDFPCGAMIAEEADAYPRLVLDPVALRAFTPGMLGWVLDPVLWGALTALGVLIAICLWSRRLGVIAHLAFACWLMAMGGMTVIALSAWGSLPLPDQNIRQSTETGIYTVVFVIALLVGAAVCVVLSFARRNAGRGAVQTRRNAFAARDGARRMPTDDAATRPLRVIGAVMLSVGIACWTGGWLLLPWTPVQGTDCSMINQSDCLGISAPRAMQLGGYRFLPEFDPAMFHYAFPVLLVGGAIIALYLAWRPQLRARSVVGIAFWLAVAAWGCSVAVTGTFEVANSPDFNPMSNPSELLAGFGIAIGFASLLPMLAILLQRTQRPDETGDEVEASAPA